MNNPYLLSSLTIGKKSELSKHYSSLDNKAENFLVIPLPGPCQGWIDPEVDLYAICDPGMRDVMPIIGIYTFV